MPNRLYYIEVVYVCSQGHLVPSDEITVYYSSEPAGEYLDKVIQTHTDFILATTKAPLKPYPVPKNASVIVQEKTQVREKFSSPNCGSFHDLDPQMYCR